MAMPAPPKSRIYAHVITMRGDRWITPGGALIGATAPTFSFDGAFVDGDRSGLRIGADNYPISALIKSEFLAKAFTQILSDAKAATEMADGRRRPHPAFPGELYSSHSEPSTVSAGPAVGNSLA